MLKNPFPIFCRKIVIPILAILALSHFATAQAVSSASITGRVVDGQNANIPGAQVTITAIDTGVAHTLTGNQDGIYTAPNLPVGQYKVEVTSPGFEKFVRQGIVLQVNDNAQIDVTLVIGSTTETVQVDADVSMVQTQQSNVTQVVDQHRIVELPLNGRDPMQLITISGGAVNHSDGTNTGGKSFLTSDSIAVGGSAGNQSN